MADWPARQAAAAAHRGDAQLGTLAGSIKGCVAAVGPGAALAAAKPDGTVADYQSPQEFRRGRDADAMSRSRSWTPARSRDQIITELANRKDVTLIVTGVGPNAGSDDPSLQVVYRLGTTLPGWLTSASTRREGIVTLTDLTRTLIEFGGPSSSVAVDGSPFAVYDADLTVERIDAKINSIAALSNATPIGYIALGLAGAVLFVIMVIWVLRGRFGLPKLVLTFGGVLSAAMMLTGAVPWQNSGSPGLFLSLLVAAWSLILTVLALLVGRLARVPNVIAATAFTVAAFTVDAALGAVMQPGSMLNSRPIFGLRWYGFGNVTFAAYASAGLLLAGYIAHRCLAAGRRGGAVVAVGAIGFGIVICEGWPSMGSDFGGVDRADAGGAVADARAVRRQDHLAEAARDRRLGGPGGRRDLGARLASWTGSAYSPGQFRAAHPRRRCAGRDQPQGGRVGRDDRRAGRHRVAGDRRRSSGS